MNTSVIKKFAIQTYGCQMNVADSELVEGILTKLGLEKTSNFDEADAIFLNTCAIRENAETKVHSRLGNLHKIKLTKPHLIIGVLGCMAQNLKDDLLKNKPYVDIILGPDSYRKIPELINRHEIDNKSIVDTKLSRYEVYENLFPTRGDTFNAWVSIMRGCNKFCSFCIVPFTRGRERSRSIESVVDEVKKAVDQGFAEITLLGQNVNSYKFEGNTFAELLLAVSDINGVKRIRYTSPHPQDINIELLEVMASRKNICNYIHFPMQSGSNEILKKMNRTYTREHFHYMASKIREIMPNCGLSTDIIVGFPGETEEDFMKTIQLIKDIEFDQSYSFIYSKRPGTPAASLEDNITDVEKKERLKFLQDTINSLSKNRSKSIIGEQAEVLVEGKSSKFKNMVTGRTTNNKIINIPGQDNLVGELLKIQITELNNKSLKGEILIS